MNGTDTHEFGIPSLAMIRARAQRRELASPPPYPGLGPRGMASSHHPRLARLITQPAVCLLVPLVLLPR